ncbi:hypothetical protein Zmor_000155 [Zophobas morio]|uniref:Alpha-carbonic anhydrase domain-containing protein n=1 Tax=Zophobas morio TaxID=2755281 RepID=A0AA38IYS6_9CUCU|nr:hypothetical protein Zmor_000155 [Zophobas morio]
MQSPIQFEADSPRKHFTELYFTGYNNFYDATVTYTEQAIRVALTGLKKPPTVCGGGLVTEYVLDAIEFRWDAEHIIDDKRYPLEAQMIHYARRYENYDTALKYKDGIAIFSTFFIVTKTPNDAFENLIQAIPVCEIKILTPVDLQQEIVPRFFLPPKIGKYYRYSGSLTTPCFNESVIWTVFSEPSYLSYDQLEDFTKKWSELNKLQTTNCRELQNINSRNVYLSAI